MLNQVGHFDLPDGFSLFDICARHHVHIHRACGRNFGTRVLARVILAVTAAAFISALSDSTDAWARGGKGGHGRGMKSGWSGKSMHGMHGKSGHRRHFPGQMHHAHRKHDSGHHAQGQIVRFPQGLAGRRFRRRRLWRGLWRQCRRHLHKLAVLPGRLVSGDEIGKPPVWVVSDVSAKRAI